MRVYDRAADRKSHPHALRLRCKERFENAVHIFWINAGPAIFGCYDHLFGLAELGTYAEDARAVRQGAHGFGGVHDQIKNDLLQLHAVG